MTTTNDTATLEPRLRELEARREGTYDKRTEHLDAEGRAIFINRLIQEDSPYLLQHAHNPVNWFPWGDEAFAAAEAEDKPIFLSIGYSTCHWCHVMEVESFDNVEVAKLLNQHFISIKMDREQFPGLDEIFMTGVQLVSGHGGWPMSNFLLPDGRPFYGATYFPAPSFIQVLEQVCGAWQSQRAELERNAHSLYQAINKILCERKPQETLQTGVVENAIKALLQREDRSLGGLAGAPKFPQEPILLFLLDQVMRRDEGAALGFVERALEGMGRGGIYDQVGGGFHRYTVDEEWLTPHFEKMLYNQAQLGLIYLQAYQLTGNDFFARVARQTCNYVLRDMQIEQGGYFSATDADSEGEEGAFFTWSQSELEKCLSPAQAELAIRLFGVTPRGNFEGVNILNLSAPLAVSAREYGPDFYRDLDAVLIRLYQVREQREHPLQDDKLIVSWCAQMATTLVWASQILPFAEAVSWLASAESSVQRMLDDNLQASGELKRISLHGVVSITGQLEDYSNLIGALISLYDVTDKSKYLSKACALTARVIEEFWDTNDQRFCLAPREQAGPKLVRSSNSADGATLSPVAAMLESLHAIDLRLARVPEVFSVMPVRAVFDKALASLAAAINENPISQCSLIRLIAGREQGSRGLLQYAGGGRVRVFAHKEITARAESGRAQEKGNQDKVEIDVDFSILSPWHITAPQTPAEQEAGAFVPLTVSLSEESDWEIDSSLFPEATDCVTVRSRAVAIYRDSLRVKLQARRVRCNGAAPFRVSLTVVLQLCDDSQCLLPETLTLIV
ncbi:MAG TPA: thioredoxin domain-containing protein [Gammaproteobacteria bacterium]|nr:thioredoxin domain-containing protein [Gammaproteobacteria bacterium]|tara:strand:+ start:497 stop:2869 length:2373 start_codon:yes stop_codon:yes gene_type:complete